MIAWVNLRGVPSDLDRVLQHGPIRLRDRRRRVILPDRGGKRLAETHPTQKLCVRGISILTTIRRRDDGRDHLVLAPLQREMRRHQRAERREGVKESLWNQAVRIDDAGTGYLIGEGRNGVLLRRECPLPLDRGAQGFVRLRIGNRSNPGHCRYLRSSLQESVLATIRHLLNRNGIAGHLHKLASTVAAADSLRRLSAQRQVVPHSPGIQLASRGKASRSRRIEPQHNTEVPRGRSRVAFITVIAAVIEYRPRRRQYR